MKYLTNLKRFFFVPCVVMLLAVAARADFTYEEYNKRFQATSESMGDIQDEYDEYLENSILPKESLDRKVDVLLSELNYMKDYCDKYYNSTYRKTGRLEMDYIQGLERTLKQIREWYPQYAYVVNAMPHIKYSGLTQKTVWKSGINNMDLLNYKPDLKGGN